MQAEVMQGTLDQPFTAHDRCDRCGAQAYARFEFASGGELLFCAHHKNEHGPALEGRAVLTRDETEKLA